MRVITVFTFLFFAAGLFLFLAGVLRLPTLRTGRAMRIAGKRQGSLSEAFEVWYCTSAVRLAGMIRMNEYKRSRLEHALAAAGMDFTPEEYVARVWLKTGVWIVLMLPALYVLPLLAIPFGVIALLTYFKENGRAEEALRERREKVEGELYRFASTITQELKNGRDVLGMLENYRKNAGEDFRRELEVLCADMRSGSYEAALTRFEARMNSPQLSDVVRGLIGVLRGDDGVVYFQMLTHDFKQAELRRLKALAAKVPPKIRVFSFLMLLCYLATFFVIIFYEIIRSMGSMF